MHVQIFILVLKEVNCLECNCMILLLKVEVYQIVICNSLSTHVAYLLFMC
jgi:hypothetical protein